MVRLVLIVLIPIIIVVETSTNSSINGKKSNYRNCIPVPDSQKSLLVTYQILQQSDLEALDVVLNFEETGRVSGRPPDCSGNSVGHHDMMSSEAPLERKRDPLYFLIGKIVLLPFPHEDLMIFWSLNLGLRLSP